MKSGIADYEFNETSKYFGSAIRCNVAEKSELDFSVDSDRQNASFKDSQDV
jgi:hypothetical protein